jgi:hypothetical protein
MERLRWTDERIDERMTTIDEKFDRQFEVLRLFREEMRAGFAALRAELGSEINGVRCELASVRADLAAFQRQVTLIVAGFAVGLLGLLSAWVALAVD